jgi:hypothetical protein
VRLAYAAWSERSASRLVWRNLLFASHFQICLQFLFEHFCGIECQAEHCGLTIHQNLSAKWDTLCPKETPRWPIGNRATNPSYCAQVFHRPSSKFGAAELYGRPDQQSQAPGRCAQMFEKLKRFDNFDELPSPHGASIQLTTFHHVGSVFS